MARLTIETVLDKFPDCSHLIFKLSSLSNLAQSDLGLMWSAVYI